MKKIIKLALLMTALLGFNHAQALFFMTGAEDTTEKMDVIVKDKKHSSKKRIKDAKSKKNSSFTSDLSKAQSRLTKEYTRLDNKGAAFFAKSENKELKAAFDQAQASLKAASDAYGRASDLAKTTVTADVSSVL